MKLLRVGKSAFSLQFSIAGLLVIIAALTSLTICLACCAGIDALISAHIKLRPDDALWPTSLRNLEQACFRIIIAASLISGVLYVFLGVHLSRQINRPLKELTRDITRLSNLDLEEEILLNSRIVEIKNMLQKVEGLRKGLRSFQKYVPAELVTELIQKQKEAALGAEKREMTIFFSDIAGFTSLAERLLPEALVEELSIYFDGMTKTILKNHGTIDKYIGDAIMAFWGAPARLENHAVWACRTALQCQRYVYGVSRECAGRGLPPLQTRIGLHTGEVLVGNIGYPDRMNYTVVGDNVNIASRLEGLNKFYGTEMLISGSTREAAREHIESRLIDVVVVKGRTHGLPLYELVAERGSLDRKWTEFYDLFNEAMRLYLSRKWGGAIDVLRRLSNIHPNDKPLRIILERCTTYLRKPPPDDWQGVIVMREK